ncbi:unnamed protein product [Prorocentrum cordatum]|uniref:Hexose transporter 1 n=1 Tax=Prorocentrum cordatum TaxID=2364126 RepID=A0ABN9Y3N5_9DINO|nr:unnamed protein product [Polarella glacialis]
MSQKKTLHKHAFSDLRADFLDRHWDPLAAPLTLLRAPERVGKCRSNTSARSSESLCLRHLFFLQVTGINVVIYFGPQILVYAGFNNSASMALTAIISIIQLSATLCLIGTVDRVGRKPLAKLGILLMCCGLLVIVAAFLLKAGPLGGWMAVGGMLTFRAAFSLSLGPLPYIMTSEFFQQESRAAGVALSWASNWAANCAVSLTFPLLVGSTPSPRQAWPMSSCSTPGALRWRSASCAAGCQRRRASASRRRAAGLRAARATRRPRPRPRDASPSLTLGPRGPLLDARTSTPRPSEARRSFPDAASPRGGAGRFALRASRSGPERAPFSKGGGAVARRQRSRVAHRRAPCNVGRLGGISEDTPQNIAAQA